VNVLVVGAGMYVSGIGTDGLGTVVPALCQASKEGLVRGVSIAATNAANRETVLLKAASAQQMLGTNVAISYEPHMTDDDRTYLRIADSASVDCAIVAVPDHLHFEVARELLRRGLHVLLVKPFVPTLAEADEIVALQRAKGVYGAVEFHKRFDEANLRIKKLLRGGAIGDVSYVLVEFSQRRTIPLQFFKAWAARSNIFQYLGVHYVDMIYFCTGARPRRVLATGQKNLLAARGIDTWDAVQAVIEWDSNGKRFVSHLLTNWIDPATSSSISDQKIKWIGTEGRIESDQKDRGLSIVSESGGVQHINPYFSEFLPDANDGLEFRGYGFASIQQFLRDVAALRAGDATVESLDQARATFAQARVSTAVIEAANKSLAKGGEWVAIDG
jgi:predicted dehydrogenase